MTLSLCARGPLLLLLPPILLIGPSSCTALRQHRPNKKEAKPKAAERTNTDGSLFTAPSLDWAEAVRMLPYMPASCVVKDSATNLTRFMLHSSDLYNKSGPGAVSVEPDERVVHCKTSTAQYAIVVPTFLGHKNFFYTLVQSLKSNRPAVPVQLIVVFSSVPEAQQILGGCYRCWNAMASDPSGITVASTIPNIEMRTLIFNYDYRFVPKFNYQATKKIWALSVMGPEYALMLDSDFELTQQINMAEIVGQYEHVLFKTGSRLGLDIKVLRNVNSLLGTSYNFFPMELPWIFKKEKVLQLRDSLIPIRPHNWVDGLIAKREQLFEIVLYNLFVLKTDPGYFSKVIETQPYVGHTFVFEKGLSDELRMQMQVPPPGTTCRNQRRHHCGTCWITAHNDRCR